MVHPTQQAQRSSSRKAASCIVFVRKGIATTWRIRPWAGALGLAIGSVVLTGFIGATAYLIYRDDLLGATLARQVRMQYDYEDRIAALRSEIDRVTSRHAVEAEGVEEQVATLLARQAEIQERQSTLDNLVGRAKSSGVALASALPAGRPVPADPLAAGADVQPLLRAVEASLDAASAQQSDALEVLETASEGRMEKLSAALEPLGLTLDRDDPDGPQGGPFVPAGELHFVERAAVLTRRLDDMASLRQAAAAMPLRSPVEGKRISSRFGTRIDPFLNRPALHAGLDFVAGAGTTVRATAAGKVVTAGLSGGYGKLVEIRHANGLATRYGHLSAILVEAGAEVEPGAPIGLVGSTGRSTGPHLHYETRRNGEPVDPLIYLTAGRAL